MLAAATFRRFVVRIPGRYRRWTKRTGALMGSRIMFLQREPFLPRGWQSMHYPQNGIIDSVAN